MKKELKNIARWLPCLLAATLMTTACGSDDDSNDDNTGNTTQLSVTTPVVTSVTATTANVSATAQGSGITSRGICYGTSANPDINSQKATSTSNSISVTLSGLSASTTYHVRAYVQTSGQVKYSDDVTFTTLAEGQQAPDDEEEQTEWPSALKRVSVHDPSVVYEPNTGYYYIFGSHRANARSKNLMTWNTINVNWATKTSTNASNTDAFTTPAVTKTTKGGQEVDLPAFNAFNWSKRGNSSYSVDGMMWAPDVIYNPVLQKWCMYLSINGDYWYSSIIMLTANNIFGPYTYQAPVVISGFHTGTSYKDTDLELAIGTQNTLPTRYAVGNNWGRRYPNCIDPCVFYDEEGKLWMSYGSWSGGIWMLELDEKTGLRDYDVTYTLKGSGDGVTVDPYFGKKIAGGFYVSGEASYIEHVGGYYYLFVTNGGLAAGGVASDYNNGGYQMRVFRSENPDGPYKDSRNIDAVYASYQLNFGAKATDDRGVNILGAYSNWGNLLTGGNGESSGERSQGHNSIIDAQDGRTYLVYHTRFQNWGEGHQVRVHQVYQNEEGWLVAAPFEYTGEKLTNAHIKSKQKVATADIPGQYKLLQHTYRLDHTQKAYNTPKDVTLNADGTISGDITGKWAVTEGTCYITITLSNAAYKGVMTIQTLEPKNQQTPCFTCLRSNTGVTIWGYKVTE